MRPASRRPRRPIFCIWSLLGMLLAPLTALAGSADNADSQSAAQAYFEAYIDRDWDRLAPLLHDEGSFRDPTATAVFGNVGASGKAELLAYFRKNYAGITMMRFHAIRTISSGGHVIFEGTLDWDFKLQDGTVVPTRAMPFLSILQLRDGQVVEHIDYADYAPFLVAHRIATQADGRAKTD